MHTKSVAGYDLRRAGKYRSIICPIKLRRICPIELRRTQTIHSFVVEQGILGSPTLEGGKSASLTQVMELE
jgi:hypothetical protein